LKKKKTYSLSGMSCVALMTTKMWPIWPSGDPGFDMPGLQYVPAYKTDLKFSSCNTVLYLNRWPVISRQVNFIEF
jgi:hypothetical protein